MNQDNTVLQVCEHPLTQDRVEVVMPMGLSVAEMLRESGYGWVLEENTNARVSIENKWGVEYLTRDECFLTHPADGEFVGVNIIPTGSGGDNKALRTALQVVVIVVAAWVSGGGAAPLIAAEYAAAAGAVVAIGGSLLVNALVPVQYPGANEYGIDSTDSMYSITGSQNQTNKYGVIPTMVGGTTRVWPTVAAEPYTEVVGEDQYLRQRFAIIGPVELEDFKIGETDIDEYDDVEIEWVQGFDGEDLPTLYADGEDIHEDPISADLDYGGDELIYGASTDKESNRIDFSMSFDEFYQGDNESTTAEFYAEYRLIYQKTKITNPTLSVTSTIDSGWVPVDETWSDDGYFSVTGYYTSPTTYDYSATNIPDMPNDTSEYRYDFTSLQIKIQRLSPDNETSDLFFNEGKLDYVDFYLDSTETDPYVRDVYVRYYLQDVDFVSRTTEEDTNEISYDIAVSQLFKISEEGEYGNSSVQYDISYRDTNDDGTGPWLAPDFTNGEIVRQGDGHAKRVTITGYYTSARLFSERFYVEDGQYDVRWRRITEDSDDSTTTFNGTSISVMRSISEHPGIDTTNLPPMCVIDLRIKASGQLSGVVDQFNCLASAYLPVYDSDTETVNYELSDSPAWAFFNVLYGLANKRRITDLDRYDMDNLMEWAELCESKGWVVNGILDTATTVQSQLALVAGIGRSSLSMINNKYGVATDWEKDTAVQVFTPRNSWGFSSTKAWLDEIHAVRVKFTDEDNGYELSENSVYLDGYDEDTATLFSEQEVQYVTNWEQVWQMYRYQIAERTLRPEIYTFNVDIENLRCTRGDRIRLVHDVMLVGLGQARIKSVTTDVDGNVETATIDSIWPLESDVNYAINIQRFNGDVYEGLIDSPASDEDVSTVTFNPSIPAAVAPTGGELIAFGEADKGVGLDLIIHGITPNSNLTAELTCQDYAPDIQTADAGTIPAYDPQITYGRDYVRGRPNAPVIASIESDENVIIREADGSLTTRVVISLDQSVSPIPSDTITAKYKLSENTLWESIGTYSPDTTTFTVNNLVDGEKYDFAFQTSTTEGAYSAWTYEYEYTVIGKTTPPPAVDAVGFESGSLVWTYTNKPIDHSGYIVRFSTDTDSSWEMATAAHDGILPTAEFPLTRFSGDGLLFLVKAVDLVGLESETAQTINPSIGEISIRNELASIEYDPDFPGTITGGTISGDDIVADSLTLFWGSDTALYWQSDSTSFWPDNQYSEMSYEFSYSVPAEYAGKRLILDTTTIGTTTIYYKEQDLSSTFWGDDTTIYWGDDSSSFWLAGSNSPEWQPWPGSLDGISQTEYSFKIVVAQGDTQGIIDEVAIIIDVPDVVEIFDDVAISSSGTRLVLSDIENAVKYVLGTVQTGGGQSVITIDKNVLLGPLVQVVDSSGTAVDGTIDATVGGY